MKLPLLFVTALPLVFSQETCGPERCSSAGPCFTPDAFCFYDPNTTLWTGDFVPCNGGADGGANLCLKCFPDAYCGTDNSLCAPCESSKPCFDAAGYCAFDNVTATWSGVYEQCNAGALACAPCYPDATCGGDPCAACATKKNCFDPIGGYCAYDAATTSWSGDYVGCNEAGAADCASCFPDAFCSSDPDSAATQDFCKGVEACFDAVGYCSYDAATEKWSGLYELCNESAGFCKSVYPDATCDDNGGDAVATCAECQPASPCFESPGYCLFDKVTEKWSDPYSGCDEAKDCAPCFPDAKCDAPSLAPVKATTSAPVKVTTSAPVKVTTSAPSEATTSAPSKATPALDSSDASNKTPGTALLWKSLMAFLCSVIFF